MLWNYTTTEIHKYLSGHKINNQIHLFEWGGNTKYFNTIESETVKEGMNLRFFSFYTCMSI